MTRPTMTETERYLFDTQGCLTIEAVLTPAQVERLTNSIPRSADSSIITAENRNTFRGLLEYEEPLFRDLIDHPRVLPYLNALLTSRDGAPWSSPFYLSHEYGLVFRKGENGPWFHGGGTPHDPWCSYAVHDGQIRCGLVGVLWALTDVSAGEGGFWYVPGSHKANFPLPREIQTYASIPDCVVQPQMRAGSVQIFSEALTHGTRRWSGSRDRIALFYKYVPGHMPLTSQRSASLLAKLTDSQRRYVTVDARIA